MHPKVSIVTVNYFSENDILKSLKSIIEKTENITFEYIIVSNSPLKVDFKQDIYEIHDQVIFFQMTENVGFATACNKGSELATGKYLFFLNPDTYFKNDVLQNMVEFYSHHNNIGIIGPLTFKSNGAVLPSAKSEVTIWFFLILIFPPFMYLTRKRYRKSHFGVTKTEEVPIVNGHALFIEKKLFNDVNRMDEDYFMFWEENDLCRSVSKLEKNIILLTDAELVHHKGTSTSPYFLQMEIEKHKSQKKYILKHHPKFNLLNRISGIIGYFWRSILSILLMKKKKYSQFITLFMWYFFKYD